MPHPEHAVDPLTGSADGLRLFESIAAGRVAAGGVSPLARRRRAPGHPPAPFVVGVGRSGTTLLRLMLDAHPELAIPAETHFVPELIERERECSDPRRAGRARSSPRGPGATSGSTPRQLREATRPAGRGAADVLRAFYGLCAARAASRAGATRRRAT